MRENVGTFSGISAATDNTNTTTRPIREVRQNFCIFGSYRSGYDDRNAN